MRMRNVLGAACAAAILVAPAVPAWSQGKTVKIVVPSTPGSGPATPAGRAISRRQLLVPRSIAA